MNDALYVAATGMSAQQLSVETIANNIANVSTPGYKKGKLNFTDLMSREMTGSASATGTTGAARAAGLSGGGVAIGALVRSFAQGDLRATGSPMDVAIEGPGFIEVSLPDGGVAFTRAGTLQVNAQRQLGTVEGLALRPGIDVPADASDLRISRDGEVTAQQGTQRRTLGRIELAQFASPELLASAGGNLYRATDASGQPAYVRPGEDGSGTLVQGSLEASNVKLVDEMVNLMVAQRAYEMSVKVMQAADEMAGMSNNLRRS